MKRSAAALVQSFVPLFLAFLFFIPLLSSCGGGSEGQQKEVKQHRERTTPLNEEVDEVRALRERMQ